MSWAAWLAACGGGECPPGAVRGAGGACVQCPDGFAPEGGVLCVPTEPEGHSAAIPHSSSLPEPHTGPDTPQHTGDPGLHTGPADHTAAITPTGHTAGATHTSHTGHTGAAAHTGGETAATAHTGAGLHSGAPPGCGVAPVSTLIPAPVIPAAATARSVFRAELEDDCGYALAGIGDPDGDGDGDWIVTCSEYLDPLPGKGKLYQFDSSQVGALTVADARASIDDLEMSTSSLAVGDIAGLGSPQLVTGGGWGLNWVFELPLPAGDSLADDVELIKFEKYFYQTYMVDVDDYDGDGQPDLQVSDRCDCGIQNAVGVFLGPLAPGTVYNSDVDAAFEITDLDNPLSSQPSGALTRGLVGDLDGDGASELLYGGDVAENLVPTWSFNDYHGNLVLFRGGTLGPHDASDAVAVMYGTCHEGFEGWHVGNVGDVTGDGRPDVVASGVGWGYEEYDLKYGNVMVFDDLMGAPAFGPVEAAASTIFLGEQPYDELWSVAPLGDLNGDGVGDLVLGARKGGPAHTGRVYLWLGPIPPGVWSVGDADLIVESEPGSQVFGDAVQGLGDADGDTIPDLLVGDYADSSVAFVNGAVYFFSGADLLSALP